MDKSKRLSFNLTQTVLKLKNKNRQQDGRQMDAFQKLASIFKQETVNIDSNDSPVGQISATPTSTKAIRSAPKTYIQKIRTTPQECYLLPYVQNAKI